MSRFRIPNRGDIYWIDPNPIAGREMKNRHRFVVITPKEINALGIVMTVPISSGAEFARKSGLTVVISGHDTMRFAIKFVLLTLRHECVWVMLVISKRSMLLQQMKSFCVF